MKKLDGFNDYYKTHDHLSVFDRMLKEGTLWDFHIHGDQILSARVKQNDRYDVGLAVNEQAPVQINKTTIKFVHPHEISAEIRKRMKQTDKKIKNLKLEPIMNWRDRHFIKNKTLFPLMKDRQVLFFTLLEGEIVRGIIADFSRYDITVHLKGGIPVVLLRHSIYDLRDKVGHCYLKSVQQKARDWEKSDYFIDV